MLGILWSLVTPLLMLLMYTFVFTVVFQARRGGYGDGRDSFALILFSGLILHYFFLESLNGSVSSIVRNVNFVKKIIFPLEVLVPSVMISAFFQFCISFSVLFIALLFFWKGMSVTVLLLPIVLLPFLMLTLGVCWTLAALGVFFRDISHLISVLGRVLLFTSTIFFPASALPEFWQPFIYLNPLSLPVDMVRDILLYGKLPALYPALIYTSVALVCLLFGMWFFQKTRRGFADVL